jgi:hypothetical protein
MLCCSGVPGPCSMLVSILIWPALDVTGLWIDIGRVLAQSDCWISCMKLDITSQNETHCKLRCVG